MKHNIVIITVFLFSIYNFSSYNHKAKTKSELNLQSIFIHDSGFIDKQCLLYMFPNIDSLSFEYHHSDKFGKYYKEPTTNNYVAIVFNPKEEEYTLTQLIKVDLSKNKISEGKRLSNWRYSSEDQILNFSQKEGYYYLPTCIGHGTGFSAMGFYLFHDIDCINNPIYESVYESVYSGVSMPGFRFLSMQNIHQIQKNSIIINYTLDNGIYEEINGIDSMRIVSTKEYNINYYLKNNKWQTTDSILFNTENTLFL